MNINQIELFLINYLLVWCFWMAITLLVVGLITQLFVNSNKSVIRNAFADRLTKVEEYEDANPCVLKLYQFFVNLLLRAIVLLGIGLLVSLFV